MKLLGRVAKVDIIAPGDHLPFSNNSQDFVLSSHVLEHFYDPIKTIKEWLRYILYIVVCLFAKKITPLFVG